ncbi:dipeptidase D [Hypnocyclicus thermotrophus]|uniref:Cytosol non-specific dipeptidase n=1 Tax=Hypnocyclicus thermotrophus TaxID=1627895 RepID=A0AA46I6E8_9FUSO|nr:aminoacyl-histidine dipeptidase [Hypnocyclicus thermotrophus]TDT72237.1 dipeptidase D [Hypnocyclicus thermotrophus]
MELKDLLNEKIFYYFNEISKIPRGSKNEIEIANYLEDFAKKRNLEVYKDKFNNILIKKEATSGYENIPSIVIQGHTDMVCEKNQNTVHDFSKDPIKLQVDGNFIKASGTTLGADNGIAVAYALALLDSNNLKHPKLEIFLTSDEEQGMGGASNFNYSKLESKIMLNIDTEEEGEFYVSCAGGARGIFTIPLTYKSNNYSNIFHIKIRGLIGGHSGMDIIKERANANKLLGRILNELNSNFDLALVKIWGGSKDNAIPRESDAIIATNSDFNELNNVINNLNQMFNKEYLGIEENIKLTIEVLNENIKKIISKEISNKIINLLFLHFNGIESMSKNINNLVESSLNLGVIESHKDKILFKSAIRSSVLTRKTLIIQKLYSLAKILNISFKSNADYPAWEYKKDSKIREICIKEYKKFANTEPKIKAVHAGLECGIISEKINNIDIISFGPNIFGAHTPEEKLDIKSTRRIYNFLIQLLENSKNYF